MVQAGFNCAFEISIPRNIKLDKFVLTGVQPMKIVSRRATIGGDSNMNGSNAIDTQMDNYPAPLSNTGSALLNITNANEKAVAIWQKWSALHNKQPNRIPFGVRGRRRNSMLVDLRPTMDPIAECEESEESEDINSTTK